MNSFFGASCIKVADGDGRMYPAETLQIEWRTDTGLTQTLEKEITKILDYLMSNYPLQRHNRLRIFADQRKRRKYISASACLINKGFSDLYLTVPFIPDRMRLIMAITHEYMHLLQHDRENYVEPPPDRKVARDGGGPHETEADLFSIEVTAAYFNLTPVEIINTVGLYSFYKLSKPHIRSRYNLPDPTAVRRSALVHQQKQNGSVFKASE